jgi:hypothetical protein
MLQNITATELGIMFSFILGKEYQEFVRIGSLLFIFADASGYQIGSSSPVDTFATRLSAQSLSPSVTLRASDALSSAETPF